MPECFGLLFCFIFYETGVDQEKCNLLARALNFFALYGSHKNDPGRGFPFSELIIKGPTWRFSYDKWEGINWVLRYD